MQSFKITRLCFPLLTTALCLVALTGTARGQNDKQSSTPADDVLRIKTELVQTDVAVFDKQGRFVDGLRPEQFELTAGGRTVPISFFERVTTGSSNEAAQLAAARTPSTATREPARAATVEAEESGRIIFFFLDDVHLSRESMVRAREALARFVDEQMKPNDQVAIVSTSGQIGFLQQLTDNKTVLRAAIARLEYKGNPETYAGSTQISEYAASQIQDSGNRQLFAYLMEAVKVEYGMGMGSLRGFHGNNSAAQAANLLKNRVRQIGAQTRMQTADTLAVLSSLMLSSARLTGRKLVLFFSDGFIIDARKSNAPATLRRVTEAAARTGAVVYTVDTRGTFMDAGVDASRNDYWDPSSRRSGLLLGESTATREPLRILAEETGGRAILNSNSIDDSIRQAVRETSDYYLLAWRPASEVERNERTRIRVSVRGRADLRVRLRSNYYNPAPAAILATKPSDEAYKSKETVEAPSAEAALLSALGSSLPQREISTSLSIGYVNTADQGLQLRISMQIERGALNLAADARAATAEVDVIGAAIDDRGSIYTFKQILKVTPDASSMQSAFGWRQQLSLRPGLYQVRVAVRERASGRTGSAMQWIEVPDISRGRFDLSSIFLGERKPKTAAAEGTTTQGAVSLNVSNRFARTSILRFQTYVYNASRGAASTPDVWIQAQVLRQGRQVMTTSPGRVPTDTTKDMSRLPYWTELSLDELQAGRYVLQVSATDRLGKSTAVRQVSFVIE